jgi:hypothetical protein
MDERSDGVPSRPVQCRVCTIYIGEGYEETYPIALPSGRGYVCWRCCESLRRQAEKRAAGERNSSGVPR